ncbi:site-specific integrase [Aeromicrobium phragmitis]|uniref:Site-specific integrase n=1 Tax=Aeromicrobium phragmitis TaxID=2478914 RepID=A0A3L8PKV1_9ACTN|nr:site-specific integrase [Aeromicrobium phragmitis]RLV56026.1 site-specific integrase [Aeromicrobium phragmitis]
MAWAEKLPSGRWRGSYRDASGKTRSAGTFAHKAKAQRAASAAELDARRRLAGDPDARKQTWGQWVDVWWPARDVEESTMKADTHRRRNHLDPRWWDVPLGAITRHDVKAWATQLRTKGLGPESVKRCVHLLSASLTAAVDAEILDSNPAARLRLPGAPSVVERDLTREEYSAIRAQLPTEYDQLVADTLLYTGARWGEVTGAHLARLDVARRRLRIVETYSEAIAKMKAYPKDKTAREAPLLPDLLERLLHVERPRDDCGVEHANGRCPGPLLLPSERGMPLRNSNWSYRVWRPAVEAAGVGRVRIHDLRHTYASWLLQGGVSLAEVGRLLGHSSAQTTQRYAHLAEPPSDEVLAVLGAPRLLHEDAS